MAEKKCQFCAETIKTEAVKCKHCGTILDPKLLQKDIELRKPKEGCFLQTLNMGCMIIIGIIVFFVIIMILGSN